MLHNSIHRIISDLLSGVISPVIFELGCNDGTDTRKLAKIPNSIIHAFEPNSHIKIDVPENVIVNRVAVSNYDGYADYHLANNSQVQSIVPPKNVSKIYPHFKFSGTEKVPVITLDKYCEDNNITDIDLLWVDVQGAEGLVFEGAKEILKNTRFIYTEYSDNEKYEEEKPLSELLKVLCDFEVVMRWKIEPSNVLLKRKNSYKRVQFAQINKI